MTEDDHYCGMTFRGDPMLNIFGVNDWLAGIAAAREARRFVSGIFERLLQEQVEGVEPLVRTFAEVDEAINIEELMFVGCNATVV